MINSLEYALEYWESNNDYRIYYDDIHVINSYLDASIIGFKPIENYGFEYFEEWYVEKIISFQAFSRLKEYFGIVTESLSKKPNIEIYCDGSCRVHTDKRGKWAFVAVADEEVLFELSGEKDNTTNSEMEILGLHYALIFALGNLEGNLVEIHCDSSYVVNSYNTWTSGWKRKNWKKANGQNVMYQDLWEKIDLLRNDNVKVNWIKGHNGHKWNEHVDALTKIQD